mmetsp:Transcript_10413/g.47807  ORF Transcript_10413/g.47807 Transcript_10413/m.47807 type:complete len:286 (-) Transcript_10413:681-1538(-)
MPPKAGNDSSLARTETPKAKPEVKKEVISPKVQHSFEDIEGLINNLLMLNTFTLGFSISFLAAFEKEKLLEMDQDYYNVFMGLTYQGAEDDKGNLMIKSFGEQGIGDTYSLSPSGTILVRGMRSSSCLTMSLIVGLASYVSMSLSDAREDEKFFIKWYSWFKWIILSGYCLYVAGFTLFYMMVSASAYALFPMYCNSKRGGFSNSVWLDVDKDFAVDELGRGVIHEGCFVKGMKDPVGDSTLFLNIMMPMILIFCGAVTYAMHYKTKVVRRGRVRADGTLHGRWS